MAELRGLMDAGMTSIDDDLLERLTESFALATDREEICQMAPPVLNGQELYGRRLK